MTKSGTINLGLPMLGNIALFALSSASAQLSIGILPAIALCVALLLSATALSQ